MAKAHNATMMAVCFSAAGSSAAAARSGKGELFATFEFRLMSRINLQNLQRKAEFYLLTLETHRRATKQPPVNLGAFARTSPVAASFVHILLLVFIC